MTTDLVDTDAGAIQTAILDARRRNGLPATGMVLTLVVDTVEGEHYDALRAARDASREHPARILVHIARGGRVRAKLDAEIRAVGEAGPGEVVLMRSYGELSAHADSVILPLLLPDAPVVAWWPAHAPDRLEQDAIGRLAQRRVSDAAASQKPMAVLAKRAESYCPGDTDLAWTRTTPWRTMLAAALDEPFDAIARCEVAAERGNPSAELLALWLEDRLEVEVARKVSRGPGITGVTMTTGGGDIVLHRPDGRLATLSRPGNPDRTVALPRRTVSELVAEELRRLDPDEVFGRVIGRYSSARLAAAAKP